MASGYAATGVFDGIHWDKEKNEQGKKARRIFIDYDKILDYEKDSILGFDELKCISNTYKWSSQISGIEIPEDIAKELEECWKKIK